MCCGLPPAICCPSDRSDPACCVTGDVYLCYKNPSGLVTFFFSIFPLPAASVLHFLPEFTAPQKSESCLSPALLLDRHIRAFYSIVPLSEGLCVGPLKVLHVQDSLGREAFSDPEQI